MSNHPTLYNRQYQVNIVYWQNSTLLQIELVPRLKEPVTLSVQKNQVLFSPSTIYCSQPVVERWALAQRQPDTKSSDAFTFSHPSPYFKNWIVQINKTTPPYKH